MVAVAIMLGGRTGTGGIAKVTNSRRIRGLAVATLAGPDGHPWLFYPDGCLWKQTSSCRFEIDAFPLIGDDSNQVGICRRVDFECALSSPLT